MIERLDTPIARGGISAYAVQSPPVAVHARAVINVENGRRINLVRRNAMHDANGSMPSGVDASGFYLLRTVSTADEAFLADEGGKLT